jgi:hypothetical protein
MVKWTVVEARMKLAVVVSNDCHNVTKTEYPPLYCVNEMAVVVKASVRFLYGTKP